MLRLARAGRLLALISALLAGREAAGSQGNGGSAYVTEEDRRVPQEAEAAMPASCGHGPRWLEAGHEWPRRALEFGAFASRGMVAAAKRAESPESFWEEVLTPGFFLARCAPLWLVLLALLLWLGLWWSLWPETCCPGRCGRLRRRRCSHRCLCHGCKPSGLLLKYTGLVTLTVLFACLAGAAVFSLWGFASVGGGVDSAACASVQMLNSTLSGQASPHFVGIMPMLDAFSRLNESLGSRSRASLAEMDAIVGRTAEIGRAAAAASQTLQLLRATMRDPANLSPRHAGTNAPLLHRCRLCAQLPALLDPAVSALEESAGQQLAAAREAVARHLPPAGRERLRESVQGSTGPLVEMKNILRQTLTFFSGDEGFRKVQEQAHGASFGALVLRLAPILLAFVVFGCSGSSWLLFACVRKELILEEDAVKAHNIRVARCASCSWCCAFCYVFAAWLAGGFLLSLVAPLSGACLALDKLDGRTLQDVAPALDLDLAGDRGIMTSGLVDQCLNPTGSSADADVLQLVFSRENGTVVTMRQRIASEAVDPLGTSFGRLRRSSTSARLAGHEDVARLRQWLREGEVASLLVSDEPAMRSTAPFRDLGLDSRGADGVEVGYSTSSVCPDFNATEGLGQDAGVVPGIQTFVTRLGFLGQEAPGPDCFRNVTCSAQLNVSEARACAAGNALVDLKRQLVASGSFRCNLFQFPNGSTCDPLNMRQSGDVWFNDCLDSNGIAAVKELPCSLAEFTQYVQDYDGRLDAVFQRLDQAAQGARGEIGTQLHRLVHEHVLGPLDGVVEGAGCGVLADHYRGLVDSLCFEAVFGMWVVGWCYVACGVVAALMTPLIYGIWLHSVGNCPPPLPKGGKAGKAGKLGNPKAAKMTAKVSFSEGDDFDELEGATPRDRVMRYSHDRFIETGHVEAVKVPR